MKVYATAELPNHRRRGEASMTQVKTNKQIEFRAASDCDIISRLKGGAMRSGMSQQLFSFSLLTSRSSTGVRAHNKWKVKTKNETGELLISVLTTGIKREKYTKRSVAYSKVRKHFNVLCSGTAAPQLTVKKTLYKYTWTVLQGCAEAQQCAAAARHGSKYPQQASVLEDPPKAIRKLTTE